MGFLLRHFVDFGQDVDLWDLRSLSTHIYIKPSTSASFQPQGPLPGCRRQGSVVETPFPNARPCLFLFESPSHYLGSVNIDNEKYLQQNNSPLVE